MNQLLIIGAGGHGKVIADIAVLNGYKDVFFLDDNEQIKQCAGFSVVGKIAEATHIKSDKFVAVGNAEIREHIQKSLDNVVTLIHPSAVISRRVKIGKGSVVMAGAVINSDAVIGDGCIINTGASVDHDCRIGDYCHVAVGAHVSGTVKIGSKTWVGAGAIVSNNVNICGGCMIGAGAVVIKNIEEKGTYVGVPAEKVKKTMSKKKMCGGGITPPE